MNLDLKKFKVVVIDYPVYTLGDTLCATLLGSSLQMKIDGYMATYSEKVLPMDKSDFFGTHLIFCEEVNDEFIPIFSYKATPYDRCLKHQYEFPAFSSVKIDAHPSCTQSIQDIINKVDKPELISFDSSWAQNLNYRFSQNIELKNKLKEIMMMVLVMHHIEFNIPHMITCGVVKVKTDQFFLRLGLKKLNDHANYKQISMDDEELVIFYNDHFSDEAYFLAEKYRNLWDNKLVINGMSRLKIAKAA